MSRKHHILVFEGPMERPGSTVLAHLRSRRMARVLKKVNNGSHEFYVFGLVEPPKKSNKMTVKVHFVELARTRGRQAFEVHYDVLPRMDERGTIRGITKKEIPNVQLTDEQMMSIIDQLGPIMKKAKVSIRWIKPGEEIDV